MPFVRDDGGRAAAGFKGEARDCATLAIAIATGRPYREVYDALAELAGRTCRNGTPKATTREYMASIGWQWVPTMTIGSGCRVHLAAGELPAGPLVVKCSRHVVAVIDGVIRDTHDPQRGGKRCVYGYYRPKAA